MLWSFVRGLLTLLFAFILCSLIVLGIKFIIITVKQKNSPKTLEEPKPKKQPARKKPVRAIYVNPEEVDEIYVKKSS